MVLNRASKTFVLFVLCTEAETGYFGGRQAVKGEESQYSLTEALCLFWVPPWGLHLSPVANIHIIDRVLYCRMAFLSPTHNWKLTLKMIQGIRKILFKLILYFFRYFHSFYAFVLQHVWNTWKCLCGNHDYAKSEKEANFVLKKVRRPKIIFWRSGSETSPINKLKCHSAHYYIIIIRHLSACIVAAEALMLNHQAVSSQNTDLIPILLINPLRANFLWGKINIYLHFVWFLHIDTTQVVEILPQIRQEPTYSTKSISWLLMSWWRKEPGHQQPWYWSRQTKITRSSHVKG